MMRWSRVFFVNKKEKGLESISREFLKGKKKENDFLLLLLLLLLFTGLSVAPVLFFPYFSFKICFTRKILRFLDLLMQGFVYFIDKKLIVVVEIFPFPKAKRRVHTKKRRRRKKITSKARDRSSLAVFHHSFFSSPLHSFFFFRTKKNTLASCHRSFKRNLSKVSQRVKWIENGEQGTLTKKEKRTRAPSFFLFFS